MDRKDWCDQKGIPYTLGLLFYGPPGTGKTSSIKAIANETGRHVINIHMSAIKTKSQLKKLFYDDRISVVNQEADQISGKMEHYTIGIEKRLYVIEDIYFL